MWSGSTIEGHVGSEVKSTGKPSSVAEKQDHRYWTGPYDANFLAVLGKAIGGWPLAGAAEESYHRHSPDHPRVWLILRHHKSYHKIIRARAPFGLFFPSRLTAAAEALGENGAHYEGYSWRTGKWGARRRHMHLDGR